MCKLAEDSFQGPWCPQVLSGPVSRCKHNASLSTNCDSVSAFWNDKANQKWQDDWFELAMKSW